jgi:hypothetical protein
VEGKACRRRGESYRRLEKRIGVSACGRIGVAEEAYRRIGVWAWGEEEAYRRLRRMAREPLA